MKKYNKMNLIDDYDFNLKVLEKMNDFLRIICDSFEVEISSLFLIIIFK